MSRVFALSDGNSFYCSCERVFDPRVEKRPVIVLSNNDGCAVSRTPEAKALGIKMGDPWFKIKDGALRNGVVAFSSNYALYGDMSRRVNAVYEHFSPEVEIYSIDESWVDLSGVDHPVRHAREMRATVRDWTGIPTCVGLGPTKTLSKVANWLAKKTPELEGVCDLLSADARDRLLPKVPIADVWGVGPASAAKLERLGVRNAYELRALEPRVARKALTVVGERLVQELRGFICLPSELVPPRRKGIAVTRSFGERVKTLDAMLQAVRSHAAKAGEKLRRHGVVAPRVCVFMHTSPFDPGQPYSASTSATFVEPTADSLEIAGVASAVARKLWRDGFAYVKVGLIFDDVIAPEDATTSFLMDGERERRERLMTALDEVNGRFGPGALRLGGAYGAARRERKPGWALKADLMSPRYTTRWEDMPVARC